MHEQNKSASHLAAERVIRSANSLPKAKSAQYNETSKHLKIVLENGVEVLIPLRSILGLNADDNAAVKDFSLMLDGSQIHWHTLNQQFFIKSILAGAITL